jgi:ubiquinone/menaquinone biosynthesis C-methylase UbiE
MVYKPEEVRQLFDQIVEQEDQLEKRPFLRNEIPREFIKKYIKNTDRVLDAGGGTGLNAILMAGLCQRVTLVDISPRMLTLAAANIEEAGLAGQIDLVEGDITDLSRFDDGAFSFIVCVGGALSHTLELNLRALQEMVRVAEKGARLVIGCDSKYGLMRHFLRYDDDLLDEVESMIATGEFLNNDQLKAHLYTVGEMRGLLEDAGCLTIEIASTPVVINSLDESKYHEAGRWERLKALEMRLCTIPELLGSGSHLLFIAEKL